MIVLENTGNGPAEAMEVEFDILGGTPHGAGARDSRKVGSGADSKYEWLGGSRVLNPGESIRLMDLAPPSGRQPRWGTEPKCASWTARARRMESISKTIDINPSP